MSDYVRDLNNYLGRRDVQLLGKFAWQMSMTGPSDYPRWHAKAILDGTAIGQGQGTAKGDAKKAAAIEALKHLGQM